MAAKVKTVGPAAQKNAAASATKKRIDASSILAKSTPRTMALTAILVCFAASGALRLGELWRSGDLETLMAAAETTAEQPERKAAAASPREAGSLENASDMKEALAAIEDAIAAGDYGTASTPKKADEPEEKHSAKKAPKLPPVGTPEAAQAADVLAALKQREADLDAYAAKLAERNEALTLAAERLDTRIQELERSREQFEVLVATVDQAATRDVAHLIKMYEKMKPKEAGPLFDSMDPSFAAGFLSRMKPDAASAILSKMSTGAAYAVSLQLAGRNVRKTPGAKRATPDPKGGASAKKKP